MCACGCNQLVEGKLWFQLACGLGGGTGGRGSSPGVMSVSDSRINDGSWHTVVLELNRNFSSLTLDNRYAEGSRGPAFTHSLAAGTTIYFGALVRSQGKGEEVALNTTASSFKELIIVSCHPIHNKNILIQDQLVQ